MNMLLLVLLTVVAIVAAIFFILQMIGRKIEYRRSLINEAYKSLAAEDLLSIITGSPIEDYLMDGDRVRIAVKTNNHLTTFKDYLVTDSKGILKLTKKRESNHV